MAECLRFICSKCGKSVESWADGNPYYIDESGKKQYAYHPDHENLERCVGNDVPHICLSCGKKFLVDSRGNSQTCPKCGTAKIQETFRLKGKQCPICKTGKFKIDPNFYCIS